jgi:hypothetical protein
MWAQCVLARCRKAAHDAWSRRLSPSLAPLASVACAFVRAQSIAEVFQQQQHSHGGGGGDGGGGAATHPSGAVLAPSWGGAVDQTPGVYCGFDTYSLQDLGGDGGGGGGGGSGGGGAPALAPEDVKFKLLDVLDQVKRGMQPLSGGAQCTRLRLERSVICAEIARQQQLQGEAQRQCLRGGVTCRPRCKDRSSMHKPSVIPLRCCATARCLHARSLASLKLNTGASHPRTRGWRWCRCCSQAWWW